MSVNKNWLFSFTENNFSLEESEFLLAVILMLMEISSAKIAFLSMINLSKRKILFSLTKIDCFFIDYIFPFKGVEFQLAMIKTKFNYG